MWSQLHSHLTTAPLTCTLFSADRARRLVLIYERPQPLRAKHCKNTDTTSTTNRGQNTAPPTRYTWTLGVTDRVKHRHRGLCHGYFAKDDHLNQHGSRLLFLHSHFNCMFFRYFPKPPLRRITALPQLLQAKYSIFKNCYFLS